MTDAAAADAFVTGDSAQPSDHESSATPFRDASRALGERMLDVPGRMSVEEKAAQLAGARQPTHPTTRSTRGGAARHSLPPLAHPGRSN